MRIGVVIQQMSRNAGGVYEAAKLACGALQSAGFRDIEVFTTRDKYLRDDCRDLADIPVRASSAFGPKNFGLSPGLAMRLLVAKPELVILHGLWSFHSLAAWIWHRTTGKPLVVVPHGMLEPWILARSRRLKRLFWNMFTRDLLARAAAVQVLTEREKADVLALVPAARCVVIPNFVERAPVAPEKPRWWRATDTGKTIFLFFGRLHEKKGVIELCRAWRLFTVNDRDLARNCELVFCGWDDGVPAFAGEVASAARDLGNVRFAGPQYGAQKACSMAASSHMILPSKSEGLPMAILEGWSHGLPSIMTEACNLPIGFTRGAAFRTKGDHASVAAAIAVAAALPSSARAKMGTAARDLIEAEFSRAKCVERLRDLCASLVDTQFDSPVQVSSASTAIHLPR